MENNSDNQEKAEDYVMLKANLEKINSVKFQFGNKLVVASTSQGLRLYHTKNFNCIYLAKIEGGIKRAVLFKMDQSAKAHFAFVGSNRNTDKIII